MRNINDKVDLLLARKEAGKAIRTKRMIKGVPLGLIALIISAVLVGAMILTIYSTYTGTMSGDIQGTGVESKWFWDGEAMVAETFSIPMDVTALNNGDSSEFSHTVEAKTGNGDMDVSFDYTAFTDPEDVGYGFYFDILDDADNSILDDTIYIKAGNPAETFTFKYSLDEDWLESADPIPFSLDVILSEHANVAPVAVNDFYDSQVGGTPFHLDMPVLVNDNDLEGSGLTITSVSQGTIIGTLRIKGVYPNQYIEYENSGLDEGLTHIGSYTIQDDKGATSTATITYAHPYGG